MNEELLVIKDLCKAFPGVQALSDMQLSVGRGEVHALMGENGAGKSTLMKILIGLYKADSGTIRFDGRPLSVSSPMEAMEAGICMIHQELSPVLDMTVADNVFLGREIKYGRTGLVSEKKQIQETARLLESLGMKDAFDPASLMRDLSVAQMQMVEIAKAVSRNSKLILMDEPTSALAEGEVETLFNIITGLKEKGVSIIYVSHRIDEVFCISDHITVMRDGCFVSTREIGAITPDEMITMMVGREISDIFPKYTVPIGETVLEARGLTREGVFEDVSFTVRRGEILGITGLMGAGRSEIVRSIIGYDPLTGGELWMEGRKCSIRSPGDAIREGIMLVTEDRKELGLVTCRSILENISLASLKSVTCAGFLKKRLERDRVSGIAKALNVKMTGINQTVGSLSGGNQQKVVLAKWMLTNPKVLILDEPTRGIDVGAKAEIHKMICDLAAKGLAVIMISSEMPEIMGISDRIIIVRSGRIAGRCDAKEADSEKIIRYALGEVQD